MRFTDKNGTVNKVINYSYNYTIIIKLVKINLPIYGHSLQNKIKIVGECGRTNYGKVCD